MSCFRRITSLLLCLLFCCPVLTGCHGKRGLPDFEIPESFDESREYEITFWAKNDTNKTQMAIYAQAIRDFEALYPNIHVNLRLYTDYGRIYNDVITNIATNTTPNVCITYPDHIATYLTGDNTVVPLDDLFIDEKYGFHGSELRYDAPTYEEIIPRYLQEGCFDGQSYAIPFMRSTEACYVNKTYVEALGYTLPDTLTWDFIWEVSDAAARQDEDGNYLLNGQKVMIPFIYKSTDNMMIQMLWQLEADYSNEEGDILLFNDTTRELLLSIATHVEIGAFSTFKISSYPANYLNAGQCVFAIDSTAGATWMGSDAPMLDISPDQIVPFEIAVMTVPQYDPEQPTMISQGPSICIFNKEDPQEVLASWLFAQYLLTNDVQIAYAQTEGYIPVTTKAQNDSDYTEYLSGDEVGDDLHYTVKLQASRMLLSNIENTFTTPVFNGSASLRDAAGQMIENVTKAIKRRQTVDDAFIDQLFADVTALYRLDQTDTLSSGAAELGELPIASAVLLTALAVTWIAIALYVILGAIKKMKANRR